MKLSVSALNGIFAVDKPTGLTSAIVVSKIKKLLQKALSPSDTGTSLSSFEKRKHSASSFNKLKVGHGGTLDPLATGVLVIGIGKGTKQLGLLLDCEKEYLVTGKLGTATDSYDCEGNTTESAEFSHITKELIESHLEKFRGPILQKPPVYSALKRQGKPLYEYARQNLPIPEIEPRQVTIYKLELTDFSSEPPSFSLRVKCSKGTYIRSLVHDLAISMNTRAHVIQLRRTCQGDWVEDELLKLDSLTPEAVLQKLRHVDAVNTN